MCLHCSSQFIGQELLHSHTFDLCCGDKKRKGKELSEIQQNMQLVGNIVGGKYQQSSVSVSDKFEINLNSWKKNPGKNKTYCLHD